MNVLQINSSAGGGGAERIAVSLSDGLRAAGHDCRLIVGRNNTAEPQIAEFDHGQKKAWFTKATTAIAKRALDPLAGRIRGAGFAANMLRQHGDPRRLVDYLRGRESFHFPGTLASIDSLSFSPDVIHCHNLHGRYFDLRTLIALSHQVPVFLTLHDEWLMTGHCAYTMGCERWRTGCGQCPDLSIYPAVLRDDTAGNLARKKSVYAASRLFVSAPSAWLIERAKKSALAEGAHDFRVIHNGVDLDIFRPRPKSESRAKWGVPPDHLVVCFAANAANTNMFKDYDTVVKAGQRLGAILPTRAITLLILGGRKDVTVSGNVTVKNLGYVSDQEAMSHAYSAADFYLHGAHADNFPTTILEALACGTPVVATDVGGTSEQVIPCFNEGGAFDQASLPRATGALVPPQDFAAMADAIKSIEQAAGAQDTLSANARRDAEQRFDRRQQFRITLDWYRSHMTPG